MKFEVPYVLMGILPDASYNKLKIMEHMSDGKIRTRRQIERSYMDFELIGEFETHDADGNSYQNKRVRNYLDKLVKGRILVKLEPLEGSSEIRYKINSPENWYD